MDLNKLKLEQEKLAKKVLLKDSFEKLELIGGVDQSYHDDIVISAIAICNFETMQVLEQVFSTAKAAISYVPGYLSYREGNAIANAFAKLNVKPDVLIFDGNGILHPKMLGVASHIGVLEDIPTIGVAKQLLLGEMKANKIYVDKELRGESLITRDHARPIYVSPGNKITLKTSLEIVKKCMRFPHKLPEPLHLAHKYANEIKGKIMKGEIKE